MNDWQTAVDSLLVACRDSFGVPVTYTPAAGDPVELTAIFDAHTATVEIGAAGIPVETIRSVLDLRLADLPAPPLEGESITVGAATYRIASVHNDGAGGARLVLHRL